MPPAPISHDAHRCGLGTPTVPRCDMIERAAVDVKTFHAATRAATTPRYPCSPRARPIRRVFGPMSATNCRSVPTRRPPPCSTTRATEAPRIPSVTLQAIPVSSRPTPTAVTTGSTKEAEVPARSWNRPAGLTRADKASKPCSRGTTMSFRRTLLKLTWHRKDHGSCTANRKRATYEERQNLAKTSDPCSRLYAHADDVALDS